MTPNHEFEHLLQRHKFKVVDDRRDYRRYKSPEGRILITVRTPSNFHTWQRTLVDLKRVIAGPVPTVAILEVERQQQSLDAFLRTANIPTKALAAPKPARAPRPSGTGGNSGTGYGYIVKVLPALTEADIELSKQAKAHDKLVHAATKDIRALRHDFSNMAASEGRKWIERATWKSARRSHAAALAQIGKSHETAGFKLECYSLQYGYDRMLATKLSQLMPGFMETTRKFTLQFGFELDAASERGWRRCLPNVIKETFVPDQGIYIPAIYRRWLKNITPPEEWADFEEHAEEPDAEWLRQVLVHTQTTQGPYVLEVPSEVEAMAAQ